MASMVPVLATQAYVVTANGDGARRFRIRHRRTVMSISSCYGRSETVGHQSGRQNRRDMIDFLTSALEILSLPENRERLIQRMKWNSDLLLWREDYWTAEGIHSQVNSMTREAASEPVRDVSTLASGDLHEFSYDGHELESSAARELNGKNVKDFFASDGRVIKQNTELTTREESRKNANGLSTPAIRLIKQNTELSTERKLRTLNVHSYVHNSLRQSYLRSYLRSRKIEE